MFLSFYSLFSQIDDQDSYGYSMCDINKNQATKLANAALSAIVPLPCDSGGEVTKRERSRVC